jgi:hypothetical protein
MFTGNVMLALFSGALLLRALVGLNPYSGVAF